MTEKLRAKLEELLDDVDHEVRHAEVKAISYDEFTERIEQAFKDAGYVWWGDFGESKEVTTGQEWYKRFERELEASGFYLNDVGSVTWDAGDVMRAAKKASGMK